MVVLAPRARQAFQLAAAAAAADAPVIVLGETGTGKDVVARSVHRGGRRAVNRFLAVNCAAISPTLVESTLFGCVRGAYTGASQDKAGVFEAASGGTVFLDEVAELSPEAQAALLRVLETGSVMRLGATREQSVDVRIVSATHRPIGELVRQGKFRLDLFFRLNTVTITLPPLRERIEEIRPLAEWFARSAAERFRRRFTAFEEAAYALLERYTWPGNIRQLRNVCERVVLTASERISVGEIDAVLRAYDASLAPARDVELSCDLRSRVRAFEIGLIEEGLKRARGQATHAAVLLGIPLRTLSYKMRVYGIERAGARTKAGGGEALSVPGEP